MRLPRVKESPSERGKNGRRDPMLRDAKPVGVDIIPQVDIDSLAEWMAQKKIKLYNYH